MAHSVLDLPATRGRLRALSAAGLLDIAQLQRGLSEAGHRPAPASWARYLYRQALLVSVALLAAGAIFFVAANWSALSGFVRMAIVGGATVSATLIGGYLGDSLAGRASSLLGALLFGPLLVVYSQVYQTGADAWELFAAWSLVLLAYAGVTRFLATWGLALLAIHIACFAYCNQELGIELFEEKGAYVTAGLALLDVAFVLLAERFATGSARRGLRLIGSCFAIALLLPFGVLLAVGEPADGSGPALALLALALVGVWQVYRALRPDIGVLAIFAGTVTTIVSAALGRVIMEFDVPLFSLSLLGLLVCAQVWAFTRWLLAWRREQDAQREGPAASDTTAPPAPEREQAKPRPPLRAIFALVAPTLLDDTSEQALTDALHDSEGHDAPLLVRMFTAIGTWFGALLASVLLFALELHETPLVALSVSAGLFVGSVMLSRRKRRSLALNQLIWAMGLGAHGLLAAGLIEADLPFEGVTFAMMLASFATVILVQLPSYALVNAIAGLGFATGLALELELPFAPLWVALPAAAAATAVWVFEAPVSARLGRSWSALAYGLPIGVAGPVTLTGFDSDLGLVAQDGPSATLTSLLLLALVGLTLWQARREEPGEGGIEARAYALGGIAILASLAARYVPGISLALLWLLLAHLRKSLGLQLIASLQLAAFLVLFYYQLETTLLAKSLWVLSTGAVLLLGAFLARARPDPSAAGAPKPTNRRMVPALILCLLTSGLVVGPSLGQERVLAEGKRVLLPLAPVDPRSLIQGDYMELRYALELEIAEAYGREPQVFDFGLARAPEGFGIPRHGALVVRLDADDVGHFARFDNGTALAPDELRLEYRLRDDWSGWLRLGAESYLFEEGEAARYEAARYGELIADEDGTSVLIGLRDEALEMIGPPHHSVAER